MGELVECSCDKNLVRHNVLLNNQMTTIDDFNGGSSPSSNNNNNKNYRNRHKKPRKNKQARNPNKRKAPEGLPGMGENWEWSGCDDNVNFGNRKSKDFLDARYRRRSDIKTLVKIHNNDAGRMVSSCEYFITLGLVSRLIAFECGFTQSSEMLISAAC